MFHIHSGFLKVGTVSQLFCLNKQTTRTTETRRDKQTSVNQDIQIKIDICVCGDKFETGITTNTTILVCTTGTQG